MIAEYNSYEVATDSSDSESEHEVSYNNNFVYVDLLGFKAGRGRFICKEFCLIDDKYEFHTLVKSSISFNKLSSHCKRHVEVATKYYHALTYSCGDLSAAELVKKVLPNIRNKIVLVKYQHSSDWLKYIFRHHLEEIKCFTLNEINYDVSSSNMRKKSLNRICDYHNSIYGWKDGVCALSRALELRHIVSNNK